MAHVEPDIFDETRIVWGAAVSAEDERWEKAGDTREEAEDWVRQNYDSDDAPPGAVVGFVAEARWLSPAKVAILAVDFDDLLERMEETEGIFDVYDDAVFKPHDRMQAAIALERVLSAWAAVHLGSTMWQVVGEPIAVRTVAGAQARP